MWKDLCELAAELNKTRDESLLDTWIYIQKEQKNKARSNDEIQDKIMEMIEAEIDRLVREDDYFKEVEYVTRDFGYLMTMFPEAILGYSNRKFQSIDNYDRYCALRDKLQAKGKDEYSAIKALLAEDEIDIITRTILKERQEVIKKREWRDDEDGR